MAKFRAHRIDQGRDAELHASVFERWEDVNQMRGSAVFKCFIGIDAESGDAFGTGRTGRTRALDQIASFRAWTINPWLSREAIGPK